VIKPALFLDRDGVINIDHGFVHKPSEIEFVDGIFELVRAANRAHYPVVVITNQSGIGRGKFSEIDFDRLMKWMQNMFILEGAQIDAVYFCPFHPEHGVGRYRQVSFCRKPAPGMLLKAAIEHDIDLPRSILIGDRLSDIEAGRRAGICTLLKLGDKCNKGQYTAIRRLVDAIAYLRCSNDVLPHASDVVPTSSDLSHTLKVRVRKTRMVG